MSRRNRQDLANWGHDRFAENLFGRTSPALRAMAKATRYLLMYSGGMPERVLPEAMYSRQQLERRNKP